MAPGTRNQSASSKKTIREDSSVEIINSEQPQRKKVKPGNKEDKNKEERDHSPAPIHQRKPRASNNKAKQVLDIKSDKIKTPTKSKTEMPAGPKKPKTSKPIVPPSESEDDGEDLDDFIVHDTPTKPFKRKQDISAKAKQLIDDEAEDESDEDEDMDKDNDESDGNDSPFENMFSKKQLAALKKHGWKKTAVSPLSASSSMSSSKTLIDKKSPKGKKPRSPSPFPMDKLSDPEDDPEEVKRAALKAKIDKSKSIIIAKEKPMRKEIEHQHYQKSGRPEADAPRSMVVDLEEELDDYQANLKNCAVTSLDDVDGPMQGFMYDLFTFERDAYIAYSSGGVGYSRLSDIAAEYEGQPVYDSQDIDIHRLARLCAFTYFPNSSMCNPSRTSYNILQVVMANNGKNKVVGIKTDPYDCVFIGTVSESHLIEAEVDDSGKHQKVLRFNVLTCEGERATATCREVLYGLDRDQTVFIKTDECGAFEAATYKAEADARRNFSPAKFSTSPVKGKLPMRMKTGASPDVTARGARKGVSGDLERRTRLPSEKIAVWDCTKHFSRKAGDEDEFDIEEILTQRLDNDPRWTKEIPKDSIVAVHTLVNAFPTKNGMQANIGFNLLGVQILVLPLDS